MKSGNCDSTPPTFAPGILLAFSVACLTGIFFVNFLSRIILSPLMPWIQKDLGISHAQAGSVFLSLSAGYFIALVGSGYLSCRIGHKKTISLSAISIGLSLFFLSMAPGLWQLQLGMCILGITAGVYLPSAIATLTQIVPKGQWGRVISVHELAPNAAFICAPALADLLVHQLTWHGVLFVLGIAAVFLGLAHLLFIQAGSFKGSALDFAYLDKIARLPAFWIMVFLFAMGITSTLGIYNMLPIFMVSERNFTPESANKILALSRIPTLATALLGGVAADRLGPRITMGVVLFITGLVTICLGLATGPLVAILVFLQPVLAVCFFPAGFAVLSTLAPAKARNLTVSLTIPVAFVIGAGMVPAFIGLVGDYGHLDLGICAAGAMIFLGAFASPFARVSNQKQHSG